MTRSQTWTQLYRMWRFGGRYSVLHAGLWGVMNLLWLAPGLIAQRFFDTLAGDAAMPGGTSGFIALLVILALGQSALWLVAGYVEIVFRFIVSALLRRNVLDRLFDRPAALPLASGIGGTINRFRDDVDVAEDTLDWTDETIGQGLVALIALAILLATDVLTTLAALVPLVLVIAIAQRANAAVGRLRVASSQAGSDVSGALGDLLTGVDTLRSAGAEDRAVRRLRRLNRRRQALTVRDRVAAQLLGAVTENVSGIGTGIVMLVAAGQLRSGGLTVGDFVLFVSFLGFVTGYTSSVGQYLVQVRQAGVALGRLQELMDGAPTPALTAAVPLALRGPLPDGGPDDAPAAGPLRELAVAGLSYRHAGGARGIAGVDIRLARGTFTVVTGRVGSGKSTLLRTILGLLPADAGEIRWNGDPVDDPATFFVPPRAGWTGQVPVLFADTLRGNLLLGVPERTGLVDGAVRAAVLERDVAAFPLGLETNVGARGVTLSGGQVQRAAVARMLVRQAELLVIDDVSSALDAETERALWRNLRVDPGTTVLAVSHRRAALLAADQVVVLRDGRVEATGTLTEVLSASAEMRELWDQSDDGGDSRP